MRLPLLLLLLAFSILLVTADHHDDSSSDSREDSKKDKHSEDVKDKNKDKKDKNKDTKGAREDENYDDDPESELNDRAIDEMFGPIATKAPTTKPSAQESEGDARTSQGPQPPQVLKTTASSPLGAFGPGYANLFGGGGGGSKADGETKTSVSSGVYATTETPKGSGGSDGGSSGVVPPRNETSCSGGVPFFPKPRPVDIWDRLLVLAAVPICFLAVLLKSHLM